MKNTITRAVAGVVAALALAVGGFAVSGLADSSPQEATFRACYLNPDPGPYCP